MALEKSPSIDMCSYWHVMLLKIPEVTTRALYHILE